MSAPAVSTDLLVIGGGVGGYTAAIRAARSGLKVLLIEASELGGTCLNRGCIPTKSLLQQGHDFRRAQGMRAFGIQADSLLLNYALVRQRKDQVVAQLVQGVRSLVRKNNIELLTGMAELEDAHTARIRSTDQRVSFKRLLIATGSEPAGLTVPGVNLPGVINSDQALTLSELPASVLILGGGVVGLEFAQIYSDFGVPVTVAEARPALIAQEDPDIVAVLQQALAQQGVEFHLGALATSIQAHGQQLQVQLKIDGRANSLAAHQVLVAVGRRPLSRGLGLERLGVKLQGQAVLIDEVCRTNLAHVYAVGDVCGGAMLAHRASAQAEVAVAHMLGQVRSQEALVIPRAVYTSPEIATVGLTETQARAQGLSLKVGRFLCRQRQGPGHGAGSGLCQSHRRCADRTGAGRWHGRPRGVSTARRGNTGGADGVDLAGPNADGACPPDLDRGLDGGGPRCSRRRSHTSAADSSTPSSLNHV